ncbi:Hyccin [Artemisia annua]|uniref:Hyccin n=1 Tax=Artemisia annua TaxID=35608 RepID=A0A2U1PKY1_ARTAN|nr:Hyccin [Artemisia annua]
MSTQQVSWTDSFSQAQNAIQSLTTILPAVPKPVIASENPALSLLNDPELAEQISNHIRQPDSGAGDNQLCRWLYDTFHTSKIDLQLVVLRFLPMIAGVYLSRIPLRKPLAGFEAVLLAIYAHETASRDGQAVTINISDASHPSVYHENNHPHKTASPELHLVVVSPTLEPQGTIRSTKRARIIGVALELYHSKIADMPVQSKLDFCEFCIIWAGQDDDVNDDEKEDDQKEKEGKTKKEKKEGRILLPWEMLQPMLRILSHCLVGINKNNKKNKELHEAACHACRSLYARALHDINPKAILAIGSLLKLIKYQQTDVDHTELPVTNVIHL